MHMRTSVHTPQHSMCVESRGQLAGLSSPAVYVGPGELRRSSGMAASALTAEPSYPTPTVNFYVCIFCAFLFSTGIDGFFFLSPSL